MAIEMTARFLADTQQADMSSGEAIQPRELSGLPERSIPVSRFFRRSLRWTRRNFSSRAKLLSGGEVLILSAPKSGRTWIRTFLCAYLCKRHGDRKSTRLNSSHANISYAVFCLKKK